jgi:hypothetical protein
MSTVSCTTTMPLLYSMRTPILLYFYFSAVGRKPQPITKGLWVSRDAHASVGVGSMGNGSFDQDRVVVEQIPESVLYDVGLRHL